MQSPIFGKVGSAEPVPLRFLGFGLFWSWLFLVAVTPSALFGALGCPGRIPFEMAELALRSAALLCILAISARHLPAHKSVKALLCCAFLAGSATTPLLLAFGSNPSFALAGAVLAAAADASLFLLWLSFFGYMRLGDALAMLVLSYAAGSVLFLAIVALGRNAMIACATFFPAASCTAFFLSARLYAERTGEAGFLENDEEKGAASEGAPANTQSGAMPTGNTLSRSLARMTVCLAIYAAVFAVHCSTTFFTGQVADGNFAVEPVCMILLACAYLVLSRQGSHGGNTYALYRACAPLLGLGVAIDSLGGPSQLAFAFVSLGYLTFEVLALNDYCNIIHAARASLLHSMARARLAISLGMVGGWCVGFFMPAEFMGAVPILSLLVVLLCATQLFSDHDVSTVNALADDRAVAEASSSGLSRASALAEFAKAQNLSQRETEVFVYLAEGRTTSYIASKLFVAESTVRAHVHSIYQKAQVSSRMELLDAFEEYWESRLEASR